MLPQRNCSPTLLRDQGLGVRDGAAVLAGIHLISLIAGIPAMDGKVYARQDGGAFPNPQPLTPCDW